MQLTGKWSKNFRSEFKVTNFCFEYDNLEEFYRSQWQNGEISFCYLLYRWIWAAFFASVVISCMLLQFSEGKFFIFLTNWGILLCLLTQLLAAVLVTQWHFDIDGLRSRSYDCAGRGRRTPTLVKIYWLVHNVALPLALVITTIYWSFLHGKMNKPNRYPMMSFVTHCLNSVFMLVDFIVVGLPFRILHTVYAMLLPISFCCFTVVYFFCGGTDEYGNHYVYPLLDWTVPSRGILTFAGVFFLYCIFGILLYLLFKLKRGVHRSLTVVWSPHCVGLI